VHNVRCGLARGAGGGCVGEGQVLDHGALEPGFSVKASEHIVSQQMLEEADALVAEVEADLVGRKVGARLSADTMTMLDAIREQIAAAHGAHNGASEHLAMALQGLQDLCGEPEPGADDVPAPDAPPANDKAAPEGYSVHCSNCNQTGHVSADCQEPEPAPRKSAYDWLVPSALKRWRA